MKKNNKGFSLVELIIVIAIMALLLAFMVPQLVKYLEKSNVSSDKQFVDTIYQALTYAIVDVAVQEDDESMDVILSWKDDTVYSLSSIEEGGDTVLRKEMLTNMGLNDLKKSTYMAVIRSTHGDNADIYFCCKGTEVKAIWISQTDMSGKKNTSHTPTGLNDLDPCIYVDRLSD